MVEPRERRATYSVTDLVSMVDNLFESGEAHLGTSEERRAEVDQMIQKARTLQQKARAKQRELSPQ